MELKHLRTFVTAVDHSSFTVAGTELKITQAAVSQHVAALERDLGTALFERAHRAVQPTDAGQRLYEYAIRIFDLVTEAIAAVKGEDLRIQGKIQIAASTVPAESLLPCLLARFREHFPEVHESIVVSDSHLATEAVSLGNADVGFVGEKPPLTRLDFHPIADDELFLVVSPSHEWANKRFVTPQSLAQQSLILREPSSGSRHCVEAAMRAKGIKIEELNVAIEMNSNDAIRAAVEQNAGIAFLSAKTVANDLEQGRLVRVGVKGVKPVRQLFMVNRSGAATSRAVREFIQFVVASQAR